MEVPDVVGGIEHLHGWLAATLEPLDAGWSATTRCEGWDVADVVLHLAQTNEMALASLDGRLDEWLVAAAGGLRAGRDVDDGAALMVEAERGRPAAELLARFVDGAAAMRAAFAAADPSERVQWVVGLVAARTLATTRLAETWIHAGDVAEALDEPAPILPELAAVARLAWRTLPYAFERAGRPAPGPVAFRLTGPDGEAWTFEPDGDVEAATVVEGDGIELLQIAARRLEPDDADRVRASGPDAAAVLELVRTYA